MRYFIGIDLGGTIIKIGVVCDGKVLGTSRLDADSQGGLGKRLPLIGDAIDSLVASLGLSLSDMNGVALAFPGIVDFRKRRAASTNAKYDDAPQLDGEGWVKERYGVPFVMDNDARMAMIGEWKRGAGKGAENMVMMTIGTGIGTGVVVDSRPLYGRNWCAGSLGGHITLQYRGRRCTCGNIGCVEAHSASFFLPQIVGENEGLSEQFRTDPSNYTYKALFDKYRVGDKDAVAVLHECMDVWAAAIVNYIHAYDPETVVVGGGIMKSADIILPYLQAKVNSLAWCPGGEVRIVASELGDDAALLAVEHYF